VDGEVDIEAPAEGERTVQHDDRARRGGEVTGPGGTVGVGVTQAGQVLLPVDDAGQHLAVQRADVDPVVQQAVRVLTPPFEAERSRAQKIADADACRRPAGGLEGCDEGVGEPLGVR
jgi:hypothetical protein